MSFRSLARTLLSLQPGYSLRALNNLRKLLIMVVRHWPALQVFLQRMSRALGDDGFAALGYDCIGVVQWPYISKQWDAPERLDVLATHYEVVSGQFPSLLLLGREDSRTLCDLSGYSANCTVVLDRPIWFKREGELVLNLFQGDIRVASLAFTLGRTAGELCLYVGAVQGIHKGVDSETSLNIYRDLTKDFEGLRPRSLVIEALKYLGRRLGAARIYAVGDAYRHHRHPYFGADKAQALAANYDVIWGESGAVASEREDFFCIPMAAAQRAAEDIAPKKRAMYRRRQALLDDLFAQLASVLPGSEHERQVQSHRTRLGSTMVIRQPGLPTPRSVALHARLAAVIRQLRTEPRADQRFMAYLRKAGLYPTLKKAFKELLRQGPGLLWRPADHKRKSLPLADPGLPASELFPREVLLIGEFDPVQPLTGRLGRLQQMLAAQGYACQTLDWREHGACLSALQICGTVVLHRVPGVTRVIQLIEEARRLKVTSFWDSDELIFDPPSYRQRDDMVGLNDEEVLAVMVAVAQYQLALLSCDRALASTPSLAMAMSDLGAAHVAVLDNQADADELTREQLAHVFPAPGGERSRRVLAANIYFAPRSFGGATVVAEQMARLVVAASAFQQFILTTLPQYDAEPYRLYRYEAHGAVVLGMGLPDQRSDLEDFDNPATLAVFDAVLARVAPDLVHLHSIQGLGVQVAERCLQARIPFVVTLHDAWWICGRQFMIDRHNQYCGQTTVDLRVCNQCVDDPALNDYRQALLTGTLRKANLLLAPSAFCRNLYIANGFDAANIRVNRNGILPPAGGYHRHPGKTIRFGFVGGNATNKGIDVIARAFASLSRADYELKVVDNLLHLGFRSFNRHSLKIPGAVSIVPGYTQANIDEFFAGIDVLLFPTQSKETFGLAVREALVRDVWVISTHAGGVVEDIVDGVNGTLIPLSSDEKYLREAVVEILEHPARYQQHRNSFKQGITLCSDQALELLGYYEEVLRPSVDEGAPLSRVTTSLLDSRGF